MSDITGGFLNLAGEKYLDAAPVFFSMLIPLCRVLFQVLVISRVPRIALGVEMGQNAIPE
jgi:hypothetical protein